MSRHAHSKTLLRNSKTQVLTWAVPLTFCITLRKSFPLPEPLSPLRHFEDIGQALHGSLIVGCVLLGSQGLTVGSWDSSVHIVF